MNIRKLLFLILSVVLLGACQQAQKADLILTNARIWTGVPGAPLQQAIAISGDSILATGSTTEIGLYKGEQTKVIDCGGKLVTAGFNDAHIHFLGGSLGLTQVELSSSKTAEDVINMTNAFINENPDAKWITGRGWQYTFYASGMPDHEAMKSIKTDKPIFIRAYDGHSAWANQAALKLAGIDRTTRYTGFGEIVFDASGEPTGALKESAMELVGKLIPPPTREEKLNALRKGLAYAASLGITSAQNASGSPEELSLYLELLKNNELTLRYAAAFSAGSETTTSDIEQFTRLKDSIGLNNRMMRADAIKFMIDGVIESHTGAMIGKYDDLKEKDPLATGQLALSVERYKELVTEFDARGFRIYTHAIGDKGVRESLNAYEHAANENQTRDARHRVEHIETISPEDYPRFKQLGVMASMEPIHADPGTIAVWEKSIGKSRLINSFAWNYMLKNGASLVYSSDWPAAISINPIRGIHVAVNRRTPEGYPEGGWVPEQKITMEQAMYAYTYMGAYSSFEEKFKGTIEAGKLADVIVFSDDLFTIEPMQTANTKVVLTVFGGKVIYDKLSN